MSSSSSLCFLSVLVLFSTLALGQIQRPNPNLRFCGGSKNEGFIPQKACKANFRDFICVDFTTGAPDPQFCSTGMCAIEAGEDGIAAIDSNIYGELILVQYLFKPENQTAQVATNIQEAFTAWETWKECVVKLYVTTLDVKQSFRLESPEVRSIEEKLEDMSKLLSTIKDELKKAQAVGINGKYFDSLVSQVLNKLSVEDSRLEQLHGYFSTLADDTEICPP